MQHEMSGFYSLKAGVKEGVQGRSWTSGFSSWQFALQTYLNPLSNYHNHEILE